MKSYFGLDNMEGKVLFEPLSSFEVNFFSWKFIFLASVTSSCGVNKLQALVTSLDGVRVPS